HVDLPVAVIPHYDNAEGGTHDTRYCYLGERRLSQLERQLPEEAAVLGIDDAYRGDLRPLRRNCGDPRPWGPHHPTPWTQHLHACRHSPLRRRSPRACPDGKALASTDDVP